ncbi:hypothetical protein B0A48_11495 [Cryoendolithus antarcticus]|uniref:NADH:ubiquinone oxidoreductase intermediate-associated protein 30 domain-containing protein n=1 Tax=Cryoendolithus antarcticus TaxID=1507870 RepID=A0A1V8SVY5_9PEZI|nr:hypothetical protein B0A48_11495 [Cryoendolithus antarcticus]
MHASPIRLANPSFWRRSIDEFKRQATIAVRMEGLHRPNKPFPMMTFDHADSIERCKVMSDSDMGGFSKAALTWNDAHIRSGGQDSMLEGRDGEQPAHALFKGSISNELPPNKPSIQRSGYAAFRTRDRGVSLFGKLLWDIDPYSFLSLRINSDGRKYFINIQTESIVPTDLHQHLLPSFTPGQWETVTIPFSAFVRTNYGLVVEPQKEMLRQKVRSVGVGLIDRVPGPFELRVAGIWATNSAGERRGESGFEVDEDEDEGGRGLMDEVEPRRKKGEPERILI